MKRRILVGLAVGFSLGLAQSACDVAYYPVKAGWEWEYRVTQAGAAPVTVTVSRGKITAGGFTETIERGGNTLQSAFRCTAQGLTRLGLDPFTAVPDGGPPGGGAPGMTIEATRLEGAQIPAAERWAVGQTWNSAVELEGTARLGIVSASIAGSTGGAYRVAAAERVTVPAGGFSAVRVTAALRSDLRLTAGPISRALGGPASATYWFAEGVGLVRAVVGETTYELTALRR